jgi:hypothetical protein
VGGDYTNGIDDGNDDADADAAAADAAAAGAAAADDDDYERRVSAVQGTGKTTVAKLMATVFRELGLLPSDHVVITTGLDLQAK